MIYNKNSIVVSALRSIRPQGNSALRDSIISGLRVMLKTYQDFEDQGIKRKYLHIVLSDGEDNKSQLSFENFKTSFKMLGSQLPQEVFTTHFIGVDLNPYSKASRDLQTITKLSESTSQFHLKSSTEISNTFNNIQNEINLERSKQKVVYITNDQENAAAKKIYQSKIKQNNSSYFVLFNLQISESMVGLRWYQVWESIQRFINSLSNDDLIGVIVFNDSCHLLNLDQPNYGLPSELFNNNYNKNNDISTNFQIHQHNILNRFYQIMQDKKSSQQQNEYITN